MAEPLRHRQTKEAATDMFSLQPPRYIPTLPIPEMTAGGRGVRLLGCTCRGDPEAIKQAKADAIKAGYSNAAVGAIGRTPSDVFLFSKLPEADQQAILRQANKAEFERYIGHAHMKLRGPMREERAGRRTDAPAPAKRRGRPQDRRR